MSTPTAPKLKRLLQRILDGDTPRCSRAEFELLKAQLPASWSYSAATARIDAAATC